VTPLIIDFQALNYFRIGVTSNSEATILNALNLLHNINVRESTLEKMTSSKKDKYQDFGLPINIFHLCKKEFR
jgi:hypothetical protein